jgi:hypothetical protein
MAWEQEEGIEREPAARQPGPKRELLVARASKYTRRLRRRQVPGQAR